MSAGLADYRERALRAEARVVELEDEVAAFKALANDEARWARQADRIAAFRQRIGFGKTRRGAGLARLLIDFLDHPGSTRSNFSIWQALHPGQVENERDTDEGALAKVYVCWLRANLRAVGFGDAIQTVWGLGYRMELGAAERLKAFLGEVTE